MLVTTESNGPRQQPASAATSSRHQNSLEIRRIASAASAAATAAPAATASANTHAIENASASSSPSNDDTAPPKSGRPRLFGPGGLLQPFRLLRQDARNLRRRWPSDWTLFNQLVLASAVYVFFTNILPGITFASDLYVLTDGTWGTIEIVFSTGICGLIFSLFSAQPLTILGVTGPYSVLAENIYHLARHSFHVPFLPLMAWSLIHAGWMHYLLAVFNAHDYTMQFVTNFTADIFSLLNSVIYFHKAVLELQRIQRAVSLAAFLYAVIGAAGTCLFAIFLSTATSWKPLFHRYVRLGLSEYAAALSIVLFVGMPYVGRLAELDHQRLMVQTEFRPTDRSRAVFFVEFWKLPVGWIFASVIPGAIITALFYFDHEISSIICTVDRYGVRKPGGYAWDIVLLGTTTALCGMLGIPPSNGLLPQAPLHSESLMRTRYEMPAGPSVSSSDSSDSPDASPTPVPVCRVDEQRYSHFLQAALITLFVSPPFQRLLGLTPTSVLAGLFLFMGYQSLTVNPILYRIAQLVTPPSELPGLPRGVSWPAVHSFTATQLVLTGLVFGMTLTVAAPAFPILIVAMVPARLLIMNHVWGRETLRWVDSWACREGCPEDADDAIEARSQTEEGAGEAAGDEEKGTGVVTI